MGPYGERLGAVSEEGGLEAETAHPGSVSTARTESSLQQVPSWVSGDPGASEACEAGSLKL